MNKYRFLVQTVSETDIVLVAENEDKALVKLLEEGEYESESRAEIVSREPTKMYLIEENEIEQELPSSD